MKVLPWDDSITDAMTKDELDAYVADKKNWDTWGFKQKQNPGYSTTGSWIVGYKYRVHWGQTGLDFEKMDVEMSEEWKPTDGSLYFVHNFTDVRAAIEVKDDKKVLIPNNTIPANKDDYVCGQNLVQNVTDANDTREQ